MLKKLLCSFCIIAKQYCAKCDIKDWSTSREERDRFSSAGIIKINFVKYVETNTFSKVKLQCHVISLTF